MTHAMNSRSPTASSPARASTPPAAARAALRLLERLEHGHLSIELPDGTVREFGRGGQLHASMRWHNWAVCQAALQSGDIGFAETYIAGDWTTPNLTALIELMIANRDAIEDAVYGSWLGRLSYRVRHWLNRNSKRNSRKNIHAHYDLGNAFYQLWLDDTMNYSSAVFERPDQPMREAQQAKVRRALRMARVRPGDRVLEIGCGWGALAEMATTEMGASVTAKPIWWRTGKAWRVWVWPPKRIPPLRLGPICVCKTTETSPMGRLMPSARSR